MHARRMTSLLAAAGLVLALAACSDDEGDVPKGSPDSSASSGASSDATSDASAPTSAASAEVQPATGPLVSLRNTATLRLPASLEWSVYGDKTLVVTIESKDFPPGAEDFISIDFTEFPQIDDSLARRAAVSRESQQEDTGIPLTIGANRTIGGVEGFVLEGKGPEGQFYEWGGLDADNVLTQVTFEIPNGVDVAEWVEPVLASLQWK